MELGSEYNLNFSDLTIKETNIFRYMSYCKKQCFFDSGRSALKHLASFFAPDDVILLPEFICESVTRCFCDNKVRFYKINYDFTIDVDSIKALVDERTHAVFLMHYFGSIQPYEVLREIKLLADEYGLVVIEDTTHSIFSKRRTVGDYQICSIRKWMPLPSGGVLYSEMDPLAVFDNITYNHSVDNDRSYGMVLKDLFLSSGLDCNIEYRKIFCECEDKLNRQEGIYLLSDLSRFIASCVDIDDMKKRRIENYKYLELKLSNRGIKPVVKLVDGDCPLVFPLSVKNRDGFRNFLMDNRIYCAVHWPFDDIMGEQRKFAYECAKNLISLPIDQRYNKNDIEYMADVISWYGDEL